MPKALSDKELAAAAKTKAGGTTALAKLFGVKKSAASQWGRTVPIPRHVKPRLEEYVREVLAFSDSPAPADRPPGGLSQEAWNVVRPLLLQLEEIWRGRNIPGHEARWNALVVHIEGLAQLIRRDMDPGARERIKLKEKRRVG